MRVCRWAASRRCACKPCKRRRGRGGADSRIGGDRVDARLRRRCRRRCGACRDRLRPCASRTARAARSARRRRCDGSPLPIECTSVVAPPGSTTSSGPRPAAAASRRRAGARLPAPRRASASAPGRSARCARSIPFAATMRSMNTSRIAPRAGSMSSTSNSGSTLAVAIADLPRFDERRDDVVGRLAVARRRRPGTQRAAGERARVVQHHLAVAAVGAAASSRMSGASATMRATSPAVSR